MTPPVALPAVLTIEALRAEGTAFGRSWRGRPRSKFEEFLIKRLNALSEELAAQSLDEDEAIAAFDTAAWDTWEAAVTSTALTSGAIAPAPSGRGKPPQNSQSG